MLQKEQNQENKKIKDVAYELYKKHGFKDEVTPGNINSPETKANMRVLFEGVVKQ